jgi:hypothetical protein
VVGGLLVPSTAELNLSLKSSRDNGFFKYPSWQLSKKKKKKAKEPDRSVSTGEVCVHSSRLIPHVAQLVLKMETCILMFRKA